MLKPLIILVVNHSEAAPTWMKEDNRKTLLRVCRMLRSVRVCKQPAAFFGEYNGAMILVVDRASAGYEFARKQGVGLARKLGTDVAYGLWLVGYVRHPFVFCSDGDVTVPTDYFLGFVWTELQEENVSAITLPFRHVKVDAMNAEQWIAAQTYDLHLRYYVSGLRFAGSPYAHHSLGSCLCISYKHYGKVRGFPKKLAGEDFYLLNKLRKLGPIIQKQGQPIALQGRLSERVPFGTGRAVRSICQLRSQGQAYLFYNPAIFKVLRIFHLELQVFFGAQDYLQFIEACVRSFKDDGIVAAASSRFGSHEFQAVLEALGIRRFLCSLLLSGGCSKKSSDRFFIWFDAIKTLKFIHALREVFFPSLCLGTDSVINFTAQEPKLHELVQHLLQSRSFQVQASKKMPETCINL